MGAEAGCGCRYLIWKLIERAEAMRARLFQAALARRFGGLGGVP